MKDKPHESNPVYCRKILRNWLKLRYKTNKISIIWKNRDKYIPKHLK